MKKEYKDIEMEYQKYLKNKIDEGEFIEACVPLINRLLGKYYSKKFREDYFQECCMIILNYIRKRKTYDVKINTVLYTVCFWKLQRVHFRNSCVQKPFHLIEEGVEYPESFRVLEHTGEVIYPIFYTMEERLLDKITVEKALNRLDDKTKEIIELKIMGYTYEEIGKMLNCSKQWVAKVFLDSLQKIVKRRR